MTIEIDMSTWGGGYWLVEWWRQRQARRRKLKRKLKLPPNIRVVNPPAGTTVGIVGVQLRFMFGFARGRPEAAAGNIPSRFVEDGSGLRIIRATPESDTGQDA